MKLPAILSALLLYTSVALASPMPDVNKADKPDARVDAGGDWVRGSAEWDWKTAHTLKNVKFGLSDYDCKHDVYLELLGYQKVSGKAGKDFDKVTKKSIDTGCNGKHSSWNLGTVSGFVLSFHHFSWHSQLIGVAVYSDRAYPRWGIRVCRSDAGRDTCYYSEVERNPEY